jgi:hypothetical protein
MMPEKINLVYIASNGRSGSTILEMLLNESPHLWTLGEFQVLPWEIREQRLPCGCGRQIDECDFWTPIINQCGAQIQNGTIARFRRSHDADRLIRFRDIRDVFSGALVANGDKARQIAVYAADKEAVLREILRRAAEMGSGDVRWLIDSSKSPYRLMWLAASGRFRLRVIHLVKDPRAFVYSMYRHASAAGRTSRALRAMMRWRVENRMFRSVTDNYLAEGDVRMIRYEDLASEPARVVRDLCDWLGVPSDFVAAKEICRVNHGIAGNPSRFDSKTIELDEKWKSKLPRFWQFASYFCNSGLARSLGYAATASAPTVSLRR